MGITDIINLLYLDKGVIEVKLSKIKKVISGTVSALMIASCIPTVAAAADQQTKGNIGGYDYEMWNQNYTGTVSMNPGGQFYVFVEWHREFPCSNG